MPDRLTKWNARYAFSGDAVPAPAEVLSRFADCLPTVVPTGCARALDLACGRAGNGEWLARRGFEVTATDASEVAIEAIRARLGSGIRHALVCDVLIAPPPPDRYAVIVVARFLERSACDAIAAALAPGGTLFYQTFTAGLANPAFLLGANELPALFPSLNVLHYLELPADASGRAEAMLVARDARVDGSGANG